MKFIEFVYEGEIDPCGGRYLNDFIITTPVDNLSRWHLGFVDDNTGMFNDHATWQDMYKEIATCVPRDEFIKALLRGHLAAIKLRKYYKELQ